MKVYRYYKLKLQGPAVGYGSLSHNVGDNVTYKIHVHVKLWSFCKNTVIH